MSDTYRLEVAGLVRELPFCKVDDELTIAAFIIFGDVELTMVCARELIKKLPEYDIIITAEAKGIPLIHEIARQSGKNHYLVARKEAKVYMPNPVSVDVRSITTANEQRLILDESDMKLMYRKKVLIVDDVVSTGNSIIAVERLVERSGGFIAGRAAILAEGASANRSNLIYLQKLPVFNPDHSIKEIGNK